MKEVFSLIVISGLLFLVFLATFLFGLIKKNRRFILSSVVALILMAGFVSWEGYTVVSKSHTKYADMLTPRTGEAIYVALFGDPHNCLKVINFQDQVIPKIDYAIWLYVNACPNELERVLSQRAFSAGRLSTRSWTSPIPYGESISWFNPAAIGDTIMVYEHSSNNSRNIQTIYASLDSTKFFCRDIAD